MTYIINTQELDMYKYEELTRLIDVDGMSALASAVPTRDNMVTNVPALLINQMEVGVESCKVGLEKMISFGNTDKIDDELEDAGKLLEKRLPLPNYVDALKLTVPKPVGMTTTYNEHIRKLISTGPALVRARAAILELDATFAKALSDKDYRTAVVKLDGDAKTRLEEVVYLTNDLLIDMKGDESVGDVVELFTDINTIPELVTKFINHEFIIDIDTLSDINEELNERAKSFQNLIEHSEVSGDMLTSVNVIIGSTANIVSLVAAVLGNIRNTKKALTEAITLIK